jgi:hypothetical protein
MNTLLENRFAPLTYAIGFLESDFHHVADETVAWQRSIFSQVETVEIESSLGEALSKLEPLITPPRKNLLLSTNSRWVAYFDNGINGGDPSSFVGYFAQRLKCRGLAVTCIPGLADDVPFANMHSSAVGFKLYAPEAREWLNLERSVSAVNDYGKWTFEATGSVQPFEKPDRYQARAVKNRFTPEMLEEYCSALGIRLFDGEFYGPAGILVKIGDPLPPEFVAISLAEAQSRLGIRSQ